jgi:hypothetical protein
VSRVERVYRAFQADGELGPIIRSTPIGGDVVDPIDKKPRFICGAQHKWTLDG